MDIPLLLTLMFLHWFADFVLQNRWMGENKSKSLVALSAHGGVYGLALTVGLLIFLTATGRTNLLLAGLLYGAINAALHMLIDGITSRMTHKMWDKKNVWGFFTVIGFDQYLHFVCLLLTAWWLL